MRWEDKNPSHYIYQEGRVKVEIEPNIEFNSCCEENSNTLDLLEMGENKVSLMEGIPMFMYKKQIQLIV